MKRLLFLLIAALIVLVGCGSTDEKPQIEETQKEANEEIQDDEIETLSNKQIELTLIENDDLKVDLLQVNHGRSELTDHVSLNVKIENKQNKTFELLLKELTVDGRKIDPTHSWISEDEVKPNETVEMFVNGYEYEELTIDEHIAGTIIYKDYEDNRNEIEFSQYINE